ncbi:Uncharacterised protein [Megamonas hypermegale]|uniref:DUF4422 domain-containing protein n=1 Tax=Megamonas hypermegale TaxID=158847 RepID=A0A378NUP7_9FIRM|nr:DUF4422 domain-containing protein [Megamonas hypermegale]STY72103.1 Uncharacterised protein [Megamonas hypermegale]
MNIKILVATHKKYWMPEDEVYLPIHVGKEGKQDLGYIGDNTGNNISIKNSNYCELTAIYWAWKNLEADYIGLVHYRRYFTKHNLRNCEKKKQDILTKNDFENILKDVDIIVPDKRKYYIETIRSHYNHSYYEKDLNETENIIKEIYPEYSIAFNKVMNRTWAHMFNMFVMRKDYFNEYCEWLFTILFELEKRIDISSYTVMEARVFGFISELLLDVWLETKQIKYREVNVSFMEKQNWLKKGTLFLKRKIVGK